MTFHWVRVCAVRKGRLKTGKRAWELKGVVGGETGGYVGGQKLQIEDVPKPLVLELGGSGAFPVS
jgi:hypothetical protein